MRNVAVLLTSLVLPAGGASAAETVLPGPVTYEVSNRGHLILRWQINPDGTGEIWRLAEHKDHAEIRKYRLQLQGKALRTFAANVEEVRGATREDIACTKEPVALPFVSITWDYPNAKQTYAFDSGCLSPNAQAVAFFLSATNTVVEAMARIDANPYIVEPAR